MELSYRHFKKDFSIPRLASRVENDLNLVLLATPWGDESAAEIAFDEITTYLKTSHDDTEATSAYEKMETLNHLENSLRSALLVANEKIFRTVNKAEYISAVELTAVIRHKHQVAWLTSGGHQIQIKTQLSSSIICGAVPHLTCPLPSHLVGIDRTCWLQCGSLDYQPQMKIHIFSDGAVQPLSGTEYPVSNKTTSFWSANITLG